MRDALLLLFVFVTIYSGFALLASSQARHWKRMTIENLCSKHKVWMLRACGYGLLGVSFTLALLRGGASFGSLMWATMISLGAIALAWRPTWFRVIGKLFLSR